MEGYQNLPARRSYSISARKKIFTILKRGFFSIVLWPIATLISLPKMIKIYRDPNIPSVSLCASLDNRNNGPERPIQRTGLCLREWCTSVGQYSLRSVFASEYLLVRRYHVSVSYFQYQQRTHYLTAIFLICLTILDLILAGVTDSVAKISFQENFMGMFVPTSITSLLLPSAYGFCISLFNKEIYIESMMHISNSICCLLKGTRFEPHLIRDMRVSLYSQTENLTNLNEIIQVNTARNHANLRYRATKVLQEMEASTGLPKEITQIAISYLYDHITVTDGDTSWVSLTPNDVSISIEDEDIQSDFNYKD